MSCYANYNYISWLSDQVSEKGSAKPHAKSVDFPSRTACQYAGREGLLSWTIVAMTGFRTHPEHTPPPAAPVRQPGTAGHRRGPRSPRLREAERNAKATGHGGPWRVGNRSRGVCCPECPGCGRPQDAGEYKRCIIHFKTNIFYHMNERKLSDSIGWSRKITRPCSPARPAPRRRS